MSRFVRRALLFGVLLATAGCGNDTAPPPTTGPTNVTVTETFAGSINRNGAATHTFLAQASGSVTVTLNTLSPDTVSAIGLSLGTWNGTACQIVIANTNAAATAAIVGVASSAGNLCVFVNDVGKITDSASYEVTVVHP
jgi:hypothetical protein